MMTEVTKRIILRLAAQVLILSAYAYSGIVGEKEREELALLSNELEEIIKRIEARETNGE